MFEKVTESSSIYRHLEKKSTRELLTCINQEDQKVAQKIEAVIPQIEPLIEAIHDKMKGGGRLFYIGAGTSGRLGILDASECPPTFGVPSDWVVGIIAGGDQAIRYSIENAEDSSTAAWQDLSAHDITHDDIVVGIAASGSTPYVLNGLQKCQSEGILTGSISCNPNSPISAVSDFPIEVVVGPEFVTGSTRMKAGTAQKMILNMITTTVMIKLGRVEDNKMVDMQLTNNKLFNRGINMIMQQTGLDSTAAMKLLSEYQSVRDAVHHHFSDQNTEE